MLTHSQYLVVICLGWLLVGCGPSGDELFRQAQEAAENKDKELSVELVLKAAEKGCFDAMIIAGGIYIHGEGVEPNKELGFSLIRKAAEAKHPDAMFVLGKCYENGTATDKDPDKARYWKNQAFEADSPLAMNAVAEKIYHEISYASITKRIRANDDNQVSYSGKEKESMALAVKVFKRLVEEDRFTNKVDVAHIYQCLGEIYTKGMAVNQSTRAGISYYEKAIKLGSKMAMGDLGYIYCEGEVCEKDYDKGVPLLRKSLTGRNDVRVLGLLGKAYADPEWALSDLDTAKKYFTDAIYQHDNSDDDHKSDFEIKESLYWAGRILVFEDKKYRDEDRGIKYLKRAAKAGCNEASYFLAVAYCDGIGVEKDLVEAYSLVISAKFSRDKEIAAEAQKLYDQIRKKRYPSLYN